MAEVITPKRQAVFDRLRRRLESYRRHQSDCIPRYNQSFIGLTEQHNQDTQALKQRFLESKAKRAAKKPEKKVLDNPLQSLHAVTQFVPKRGASVEDGGPGDGYGDGPPPPKQQAKQPEGLTKFSVEIVQQLEFTTSANNSQISTNVTVKALNTSVKSDLSTSTTATASPQAQPQPHTPVECKQEQQEDSEFVDLEQCAAALEKDAAAHGGSSFPGLSDLIGDETSDAIITSDAFKDLISEISDSYPFMNDFDFDNGDSKANDHHGSHSHHQQHVFKTEEDSKCNVLGAQQRVMQGMQQQQHQQQRLYSSPGMDFTKAELSPAAQTLKQMAEQHQHKTQLGMNFNPAGSRTTGGKPYSDFQYNGNDFLGSPQNNSTSGGQQFKPLLSQSPKSNFVSSENIKQEVFSAQNSPGVYSPGSGKGNQTPTGQPRLSTGFKQQYSPYGSPGAHGSPQYTPRAPQGPPPQAPPPRPPSCPSSTTLQINQAQQLHISQAQGQPPIQVSLAQNLCTEMKGNNAVSVAAQQGLYLNPVSSDSYCSVSQSQSINFTQQSMRHRVSMPQPHQQDKMMHPQEKMMHPQEKMMHSQEKMMHPQEKMMHQQDKIMHPQEKMMHPQMIRIPQQGIRPPPPEYKASPQTLHPSMLQQRGFPSSQPHHMTQQPVPPSGPMMRPQSMPQSAPCAVSVGGGSGGSYLMQGGGGRLTYSRPQRPQPTALSPEWRHIIMQQQQHQQRPAFHQAQGVVFRGGDMQMAASQMQQVSHLAQQQSLAMQHTNPQMSVNLQMQQSMGGRQPAPATSTPSSVGNFPPSYGGQYSSFNPQIPTSNDFNLDFLDQNNFTDQDFLSSFNLQDIL